jgi:hypothetical protein
MSNELNLALAIFNFARASHDPQTLTKLSEMAWSLKPLIEENKSGIPKVLGQELWLYIGLQRDANTEMAQKYAQSIEELLHESPSI